MNYIFKWASPNKEKVLNIIVEIMKDNGAYFIDYNKYTIYFIIPNNWEKLVPKNCQQALGKEWKDYTCSILKDEKKYGGKIISVAEYEDMLEAERQKVIAAQERAKKAAKEKIEREEAIEGLTEEYGNRWRSYEWIRKNIGTYHTEEPMWQYFWTLIGDNWQVADWKHNIKIEESIYKRIENMRVNGQSGKVFLGRTFKNAKGYSAGIIGTYRVERKGKHYGVYGLFKGDKLMYVGSTIRDFEERLEEHEAAFRKSIGGLYVYSLLDEIDMRVLIDCSEIKANKTFTIEDVESMELALIQVYQPEGNLAGRTQEFRYHGY